MTPQVVLIISNASSHSPKWTAALAIEDGASRDAQLFRAGAFQAVLKLALDYMEKKGYGK